MDQLSLIFDVIGAPSMGEVAHIRGAQARKFLDKLGGKAGVSFSELLPGVPEHASDLLAKLLLFDPAKRCTAVEALDHRFFDGFRSAASSRHLLSYTVVEVSQCGVLLVELYSSMHRRAVL